MEIKAKSGKKFKVKDITLDERDSLLDSLKYNFDDKGKVTGMDVIHSTTTKWFRTCLEDCPDDVIMKFSMEEKTELFTLLQKKFITGEEEASK